MLNNRTIIIIPDAYIGSASGAVVAQTICRLLLNIGLKIVIFSQDVEDGVEESGIILKKRLSYTGCSNWNEVKHKKEIEEIIDTHKPYAIFSVGSITNKPLCYLEISKGAGIRTIAMIFMQDFFCIKYYANDIKEPCTKCLGGEYGNSIKKGCYGSGIKSFAKGVNSIFIRKRLYKILPKLDCVITSSDEQVQFYKDYGIPEVACLKTPLFYDRTKLAGVKYAYGSYYICIAQDRAEKGFQYLPKILDYCDNSVHIIVAYNGEKAVESAISKYGFRKYIEEGKLKVENLTFKNGLKEILACAKGVIIPTIWPTTTEYGLLESLGMHKIVYTFDVGIHREIIHNGVNGFVAPIGDCKQFAANLMNTISEEESIEVCNNAYNLYERLTDDNIWIADLKKALAI